MDSFVFNIPRNNDDLAKVPDIAGESQPMPINPLAPGAAGFEDPLLGFEDPLLGATAPMGFEDPLLG
ncbi:hypothetical protein [Sedimentitalea todarodis]|uniref:Uncharacterized protein n=1 Tax=Sedimentitalea todarodis TaxID=1631240 RepID=A0ABU3VD16_9RHOB|nr:hypothetical protein [Sedimentitalea todarodis]MDU9004066.1 hypothetical protein [Sedimentitalea todarodis]